MCLVWSYPSLQGLDLAAVVGVLGVGHWEDCLSYD